MYLSGRLRESRSQRGKAGERTKGAQEFVRFFWGQAKWPDVQLKGWVIVVFNERKV